MQYVITYHARLRMRQRGVDEESIRATLTGPDEQRETPEKVSMCFLKSFGDRTLKVWVVWPPKEAGHFLVKSAAWKGEPDD